MENNGYEVLSARDGQEAWEIFQKEKQEIGIALIDWVMTRLDGLELCKKISSHDNVPELLETLIKKVDDTLYEAKETVRNKVVYSDKLKE